MMASRVWGFANNPRQFSDQHCRFRRGTQTGYRPTVRSGRGCRMNTNKASAVTAGNTNKLVRMGTLKFRLQYDSSFDQIAYVVGNIKELGQWKVLEGLELGWNPGNIWEETVDSIQDPGHPIEYKYVIVRQRGIFQDALWESGPNRVIDLKASPRTPTDHFRVTEKLWLNLGAQGIRPEGFTGKRDGQKYMVRLLQPNDARLLGDLFAGLSENTLRRYRPHDMTAEHAQILCEQQRQPSDTLRFVVTTVEPTEALAKQGAGAEKIVGYMIVDFAIPHYEIERYAKYGITNITSGVDCSYAPVVADSYQGRGIAFDAMQCVFRQLKGARNMLLLGGVQDSNDRAKAFYRKLGFQEVGGYHGADQSYNLDMVVNRQ